MRPLDLPAAWIGLPLLVATAFGAAAATAATTRPQGQMLQTQARNGPTRVAPVRGKYCAFNAPPGWFVKAENAQRVGFGADFNTTDGALGASYAVMGGGKAVFPMTPQANDPHWSAMSLLTLRGQIPFRFGPRVQLAPNLFGIEYGHQTAHGVAFYQVFPSGPNMFVIVMRSAVTSAQAWPTRGGEAVAIARSVICNVPTVPAAASPPSTLTNPSKQRAGAGKNKDEDSLYNVMLDREYYHDERGNNYWVSPSHDWSRTGPDGEGYYTTSPYAGGTPERLKPGYAH